MRTPPSKSLFGDKLVEGAFCNVKAESERAEVLRRSASLIIWDEIPTTSKLAPGSFRPHPKRSSKLPWTIRRSDPFNERGLETSRASGPFWNS